MVLSKLFWLDINLSNIKKEVMSLLGLTRMYWYAFLFIIAITVAVVRYHIEYEVITAVIGIIFSFVFAIFYQAIRINNSVTSKE